MSVVLTIAGSDPSGGAGIQADLRVIQDQGLSGVSVITALTVQNSRGVSGLVQVDSGVVGAQLEGVLSDVKCAAVKIGLLPGAGAVAVVAEVLQRFQPPQLVLDPVLQSSGGVPFLDQTGREALLRRLLPLCTLLTPNLDEAAALTGLAIHSGDEGSLDQRIRAARWLQDNGAAAVLIKGGHLPGDPRDLLLSPDGTIEIIPGQRVDTIHTHGTGCFLSSAIACRLALGDTLRESVARAKRLLEAGLRNPVVSGAGRGSPGVSSRRDRWDRRTHAQRLQRLRGLYVITDPKLQGARSSMDVAAQAFAGGACVVQLRDKTVCFQDLVAMARQIQDLALSADRLFIVNDRVDAAVAAGADGVHLGPDDMDPADARAMLGWDRLVGVSVGTVEEAIRLAPVASYFGVGAIFGSTTKLDAGAPVGLARIREIRRAVPEIPIVAIGGINEGNISGVIEAGACSAAVISAVVADVDVAAAVKRHIPLIQSGFDSARSGV